MRATAPDRLPHGYRNLTRRLDGVFVVEKTYTESDARERLAREELCLRVVADVLPVPRILDQDEDRLVLRVGYIEGIPGPDLIEAGFATEVLAAAGSLLARVQTNASPLLIARLPGDGSIAVHGDYGPHNLLFDADHRHVTGLVDWEFVHLGDAVEDLAWAEWVVRMHYRTAIDALDALFTGYGARPGWSTRHAVMIHECENLLKRAECEGAVDSIRIRRSHLLTTERWTE